MIIIMKDRESENVHSKDVLGEGQPDLPELENHHLWRKSRIDAAYDTVFHTFINYFLLVLPCQDPSCRPSVQRLPRLNKEETQARPSQERGHRLGYRCFGIPLVLGQSLLCLASPENNHQRMLSDHKDTVGRTRWNWCQPEKRKGGTILNFRRSIKRFKYDVQFAS